MRRLVRNPKDFWSGAVFIAFGLTAILLVRGHPMGSMMCMGPAYFPLLLGVFLALIGLAILVRSLVQIGEPIGRLAYSKVGLVIGSNLLFALLLRRLGLVASLVVLVVGSAYASRRFSWGASLLLAVGLTAFCVVTFVKGLGLSIQLFPGWFGG
jgi:putative tricarboxylic transport membrane protein